MAPLSANSSTRSSAAAATTDPTRAGSWEAPTVARRCLDDRADSRAKFTANLGCADHACAYCCAYARADTRMETPAFSTRQVPAVAYNSLLRPSLTPFCDVACLD